MNDRAEGTVADTGEALQKQINRADDALDEVTTFVRNRPILSLLIAVGVGYLLGKVV